MTTIACDGESMAADGLINSSGTVFNDSFDKARRLKDGRIVGVAGNAYDCGAFVKWLEEGGDKPELDSEHFDALVLMPSGEVLSYDHRCRCIPETVPTACGSGRDIAIGAMEAGASPHQAVQIASRRDTGTGGKITVLERSIRNLEAA